MLALKELEVLQQVSEGTTKGLKSSAIAASWGALVKEMAPAALGLDTASCWALCMEASTQSFLKLRKIEFEV